MISTKKISVKSPSRVQLFRSTASNTPFPPALDGDVLYYAQQSVKEVFHSLDSCNAASMETVQSTESLSQDVLHFHENWQAGRNDASPRVMLLASMVVPALSSQY